AQTLHTWAAQHDYQLDAVRSYMNIRARQERRYELSYRLIDRSGTTLVASYLFDEGVKEGSIPGISDEALREARRGSSTDEYLQLPGRPHKHLLMTRPFEEKNTGRVEYMVQILVYLEPLDKLARSIRHIIYSVVPPLIVTAWFSGYALARKVLRPINEMAGTARAITSAKLDQRLDRSGSGDEFDMLAATLNDMIERLEKSFDMLRQFAADAAHELRTPLTIMKGEAEIALRARDENPETYRSTLESTIRECDRMIGVISDLLLIAQAEAGDIPVKLQPFRLDELLADLTETFQVLAEEAQLSLDADPFPEILVDGDPMRLHELFANLLDNAVKYTPAGGRIAIACDLTEREVHVHVSDTGVGVPEDEVDRIFDRFYRVDRSRSRHTGGSGLGLSIARWIAEAHRGRVEVQSAEGAGTTFTVILPLHGVPPAEPPALPPEA
ncbi:MAG: sensor histidine kinase, partial [Planctomycetota bacterium]